MPHLPTDGPRPVPVRKLHDDGFMTVRYLMPDGTEPEELPDDLLLGANPQPITAIWEPRYNLFDGQDYWRYDGRQNMLHLSKNNPLLFEEVLCFLESAPREQRLILSRRIIKAPMHPSENRPNDTYFDFYRAMMDSIPMLVELSHDALVGTHTSHAQKLFTDGRKTFGGFTHPHFNAGIIANWIMQRHTGKRTIVAHEEHVDDIAFIHDRHQEVMESRYDLARIGSINHADIARILATPMPVRDGTL